MSVAENTSLPHEGFAIVSNIISRRECEEIVEELGPVNGAGRRGILGLSSIARLANSERLLGLARPHLPALPRPVRGIYFDKNPQANWMVTWHQDLTVAVRNQIELPGFGPWSIKEGVSHVQPPIHLLEQMLTIRLHLDDCDESNGALRVIPGSHRLGRLSANSIEKLRSEQSETVCCVAAGGALLMRPLLLHSSSRSLTKTHRRVVHIEYSGFCLPAGLQWNETQ